MMRRLSTHSESFDQELHDLLSLSEDDQTAIEKTVISILKEVQIEGDDAVIRHTNQFDRLKARTMVDLQIMAAQLNDARQQLPLEQLEALENAAMRVRSYHERQMRESGCPLDRVGIYVPGGKAAYPSSVLMNAIPAKVAGVGELVMVVPTPDGLHNPLVLAAAAIAGVDRVFTIGGAQAIGALAYGTKSIPAVDKIVGPGNAFVACAKRRVFGTVGIDMIAGPSEILVLCDGKTPPDWVAMDLFSQAEHDELAQSILLCPNAEYLDEVVQSIDRLIEKMPRKDIIRSSLKNRGAMILVDSMEQACHISNQIAPEHLEISAENPRQWLNHIRHAGAIFLGKFTSESLGDYCAGPNHVLPTSRTARFSSPLGVYDFIKRSSLIEVSEQGAQSLGQIASVLANGEGLQAHAMAAHMRLK